MTCCDRALTFHVSSLSPVSQTGVGLWPAGLCIWTVPPGGVHMDLHVPVCVAGSLQPFPCVVTDSVWVLQSPQVVHFAVWVSVSALPSSGPGISPHLCGDYKQFATCVLLHHHPGTGWLCKHFQTPFWKALCKLKLVSWMKSVVQFVMASLCISFLFVIPDSFDDESTLLCQGECAKSSDLG